MYFSGKDNETKLYFIESNLKSENVDISEANKLRLWYFEWLKDKPSAPATTVETKQEVVEPAK